MSTMEERQDAALFTIRTPVCLICKNKRVKQGEGIMCTVITDIPKDVLYAELFKCQEFILDEPKYELNKPFLPKDFDVNTVTE